VPVAVATSVAAIMAMNLFVMAVSARGFEMCLVGAGDCFLRSRPELRLQCVTDGIARLSERGDTAPLL
jgi:hypothetical protein